jgi:hypothetical protein
MFLFHRRILSLPALQQAAFRFWFAKGYAYLFPISTLFDYSSRSAVFIAAKDDNLFGALLLNAFSDHFLEDYFAPGHIITPRERLHDVASLGIHDNYNSQGARFRVENWHELEPLIGGFNHHSLTELRGAAEALSADMTKEPREITLYGDNTLKRDSKQRALMVLVVARSILDVVTSFENGEIINNFERFTWKSRTASGTKTMRMLGITFKVPVVIQPIAMIKYGQYVYGELQDVSNRGKAADAVSTNGLTLSDNVNERLKNYYPVAVFSPILGLTVDYQTFMRSGSTNSRGIATAEILPLGTPPPGNYLRTANGRPVYKGWQWGAIFGYSFLQAQNYSGHGPSARIAFPLPDVDTQVSVGTGARNYFDSRRHAWRPNAGVTLEHGFGLVFVRLGLGWDSAMTTDGARSGAVVSGGLTLTSPWSRISRQVGGLVTGD